MLKIRLQRIGKKNDPSYRVVLIEHTKSPHGKSVELLGSYNSKLKQKKFNKERIQYWLTKGAQASATIHNLLVDEKIINEEKVKSWKPKAKKAEAASDAAKKPEAPKTEEQSTVEVPIEPIKTDLSADLPAETSVEAGASAKAEAPVDTEPKKE